MGFQGFPEELTSDQEFGRGDRNSSGPEGKGRVAGLESQEQGTECELRGPSSRGWAIRCRDMAEREATLVRVGAKVDLVTPYNHEALWFFTSLERTFLITKKM